MLPKIKPYLAAARQSVEQELISVSTTQKTYELRLDTWYGAVDKEGYILLPMCPLVSITSIKYDDVNNAEQTLASTNYQADTASLPGRVRYTSSATLPGTFNKPNAIRIRYVAGYGAAGADDAGQSAVPAPIKAAVLMRMAELYEIRTETVGGMNNPATVAVQRLISPYRVPC